MNSGRVWGGKVGVSQPVLPLLPADAVAIGAVAGLVETADGGVVFVCGLATFAFAAGDEVGRRLAAVQLVATRTASAVAVATAFGVTTVTLWRWASAFESVGVAGLIPGKTGPKRPAKLTSEVATRIRELNGEGLSLAAIGARVGVSTATVRVALGRVTGSVSREVRQLGDTADDGALPVLPMPEPRTAERVAARTGELVEAPVVFTQGAHLPLAGLLLILPALAATGLVGAFEATYGRLRKGFYGLRATLLMLLFLALLRDPRAEGATRIRPADLGRLLGLDRAPEVKTLRRKLIELAGHQRGAQLQAALAKAHANARPQALGFLYLDGHVRVYSGTRDLPKTHIARMHLAGHATNEIWIADSDADPVLVVTAPPAASLASELVRLLPELRGFLGPDQRATVIFDRGGWSAATFAKMLAAGLDVLTYRKAPFDRLPDSAFTEHIWIDPDGDPRNYLLAETSVELPLPDGGLLTMRQIHRRAADGAQIPVLTSRTDLSAAELCWRLAARWRQENYFKYAREHFALDALDSYADTADDPDRLVPSPTKHQAKGAVEAARADLARAENAMATAIDDAVARARRPGSGGTATVDPAADRALTAARTDLQRAAADSRATPSHIPLRQIRPDARLLDEQRKLLTHAIRIAAYNAESTLARMLRPHYARAEDEARALLREAMTLSGDIRIIGDTLHVTLDPATAPRRSRALHALCQQLTATETIYPDTELKIVYSVKGHPNPS
jgi:transposase-like protein